MPEFPILTQHIRHNNILYIINIIIIYASEFRDIFQGRRPYENSTMMVAVSREN